jgi:metal transporter CNNM
MDPNTEATLQVSPESIHSSIQTALEIIKAAGLAIDQHGHLIRIRRELLLEEETTDDSTNYYVVVLYWFLSALALALVALIAALYLGLLTLDTLDLQIKCRASLDADERRYARALIPVIENNRHLLLVTLMILEDLAYELLPIFLELVLQSRWVVVVLSTTLILLFGEILPSAIFTGPHQLVLIHAMIPLVNFLLWAMSPIAGPLSKILDYLVYPEGHHVDDDLYNRVELSALVSILYETQQRKKSTMAKKKPTKAERKLSTLNIISPTKQQRRRRASSRAADSWGGMKQEMLEAIQDRNEDNGDDDDDDDNTGGNNASSNNKNTSNSSGSSGSNANNSYLRLAKEKLYAPPMEKQEVDLVVGALQMKTKVAMDVYTPLRHVYGLADNLVLDRGGMTEIYAEGYSRVPVYHRLLARGKRRRTRRTSNNNNNNSNNNNSSNNREDNDDDDDDDDRSRWSIMGYFMTRQLMMINWDHEREASTLPLWRPDAVRPRMNLVRLLKLLRDGGNHMAFVCARPDLANRALRAEKPIPPEAGFMGIVTFEDIMESILRTRIYDEMDIRDRDRAVHTLTKWAAEKLQSFARRRRALKRRQEDLNSSFTEYTLHNASFSSL